MTLPAGTYIARKVIDYIVEYDGKEVTRAAWQEHRAVWRELNAPAGKSPTEPETYPPDLPPRQS